MHIKYFLIIIEILRTKLVFLDRENQKTAKKGLFILSAMTHNVSSFPIFRVLIISVRQVWCECMCVLWKQTANREIIIKDDDLLNKHERKVAMRIRNRMLCLQNNRTLTAAHCTFFTYLTDYCYYYSVCVSFALKRATDVEIQTALSTRKKGEKKDELRPLTICRPQNRCFLSSQLRFYHSLLYFFSYSIYKNNKRPMKEQRVFSEKGNHSKRQKFLINRKTFLVPIARLSVSISLLHFGVCVCLCVWPVLWSAVGEYKRHSQHEM